MDIAALKDKLGDDYEKLAAYVDDLTGQRDAARKESIEGRKGLKAKVDELTHAQDRVLEKLGISSLDDLDNLPEPKGQAEAVKQFEAKLKKLERDMNDRNAAYSELETKHRASLMDVALSKALASHEWVDNELATLLAKQSIQFEGDDLIYKSGDKIMTLEDGIKTLATAKPHLLKSAGAGGSGYQQQGNNGSAVNPWSKDAWNVTEQIQMEISNPQAAVKFKAEAGMAQATKQTVTLE